MAVLLLVGGIGVMNIMYVSVIERCREISIRMAISARRANMRRMFLIESIILTIFFWCSGNYNRYYYCYRSCIGKRLEHSHSNFSSDFRLFGISVW
ncbi:FtsX-like permease family protein [Candidatus Coxiella mudrowiae]|uniref:FtsX-like permease family protein n=1 Tax=Candidatus Coxiella mudrowiae TaxID=2054173 RepID=UPI00069D635A|nr:FtsX-like permease family protein [Candidatus Coxiella mudrowiae]